MILIIVNDSNDVHHTEIPNFNQGVINIYDKNKRHKKAKVITLTDGIIYVQSVKNIVNVCGNVDYYKSYIEFRFLNTNSGEHFAIISAADAKQPKVMKQFLKESGILFEEKNSQYILYYIEQCINQAHKVQKQLGFHMNDGIYTHHNYDEIMLESGEKANIQKDFGLFPDMNNSELIIPLTYLCMNFASAALSLVSNDKIPLPTVVLYGADNDSVIKNAKQLFVNDEKNIILFNKNFKNNLSDIIDDIALILMPKESEYMIKKDIQTLSNLNMMCDKNQLCNLRILASECIEYFEENGEFIFIPCLAKENICVKTIRCWFQKELIKEDKFRSDFVTTYQAKLNEYSALGYSSECVNHFIALMISAAKLSLESFAFSSDKIEDVCEELYNKLLDYSEVPHSVVFQQIAKYLRSERDFPVIHKNSATKDICVMCDDTYMYFNRKTLAHIAKHTGNTVVGIVNELNANKMLVTQQNGKMQRNVYCGNTTQHLYTLRQEDFFNIGEVRLEPLQYTKSPRRIFLGYNGENNEIYFLLGNADEYHNRNCCVLGTSGTGKSYFLSRFAKSAANNGCEVVFISKCDSRNNYLDTDEIFIDLTISEAEQPIPEIEWEDMCQVGKISMLSVDCASKSYMDNIIDALYAYKSSHVGTECVVVLDECQDFNLEQKSSLVNNLMRKGRKIGLITVLSTQYINSGVATNLSDVFKQCTTTFEFNPSNTKKAMDRLSVKSDMYKDLLDNLDVGVCLAKGRLATRRCEINYPITIQNNYK